ncbi:Chaperone J-domain superfamily [Arabidopsis thaliana x Arabidopsis arenosa]|uniref:Chaperone J-domain superfamily n=1 Tax=Arabidopsis thaliana x Arabidopsis arenosa TaxID=1240361 RepID=A0A8T1YYK1_9BRAS|nr:Chaperone J-domain superfamily [Arabidopsis thaliana x Arabidopsis arenosa]
MSNKDEALRAKELAEDWMSKSDFTTARRIALKAQKMDASLENVVARMIMVCDVHCAALEKSGDETDWYKILQVEQNADEHTIKKQYRKLALHLHPDKNKLPGAESAFKTIGEAQRVLLDKDKRRLHDIRRKPVFRRPAPAPAPATSFQPQQASTTPFFTQRVFQTNVNAARKRPENQKKPQAQQTGFGGDSSFCTSCPLCHMKYEYQRVLINTQMNCMRCGKQYIALQENCQGPPGQATFPFFQQSKVPTQEAGKAVEKQPESSAKSSLSKEGSRAKSYGVSAENINGKRKRKKVVESSDSSCSESSIECKEVPAGGQDSGSSGAQHSRRSVRSKQQVSYKENKSDDDNKKEDAESAEESDFRKKSHEDQLFAETLPNGINRTKKIKKDQVGSSRDSGVCNTAKDSSSGSASDAEIECTDPDFSNFEKSREVTCFKAGQTWAMYDDMGRMPRYYALIRKVIRKPSFMLKIQWLEARPDDEKAIQWVRKKLPISIGKFKLGGNLNTEKTPCFSHLIYCRVGSMKDTVRVYPRIGETWALFKNWDINWSSGRRRSSHEHEYEYDFVEILSEYVEGVAIEVAFLRKLKGFASVFCRIALGGGSDTIQIPPHELLRFSHNIPSTKLTGNEGNGVPIGSYELDTAALPQKIEEEEAVPVLREAAKLNQVHHHSPPSSEPDCIVIPNFQFNNFSAERLEGKFAPGQIWSLNSKEDGLPKCYARIQQIVWRPVFKLQINRLEPKSFLGNVIQWHDKKMPVSCGNFTLKEGRDVTLTNVTDFSHQIKAENHFRKNEYIVVPKTGEIWAMYKNWSETIKAASLKKCEYEVVEVLDDNDSHIEVMLLERVDGFITVFKEKVEGGIDVKKKIPRCELLRFSHYVPAFRLTGERDGALRGYVELDPSALPRNLRRS